MTDSPFVSIIIPAYNEENRIPATLEKIATFLKAQDFTYEVIVVENGSQDRTYEITQEFVETHDNFRVLRQTQSGKGRAIRRGMLEAKGAYRFMCDADLSMPIEELPRFLPPNFTGNPVVIGSREAPGAVRYDEPNYRHIGGRLLNYLIRLLALPGINDTQCGFKSFREDAALDLFSKQTIMGWSFDVEILFLARRRGYAIMELPIPWHFMDESHVEPVKNTIQLGIDLLKVRWNALTGKYGKKV